MKLNRISTGWYASEDGKWAVQSDGYDPIPAYLREGHGVAAGITGGEWAVVHDAQGRLREDSSVGENLNWYDTKREAVASLDGWVGRV